ncbi:hypothetical protein GCM10009848_28300 [Micromonospora lupini]
MDSIAIAQPLAGDGALLVERGVTHPLKNPATVCQARVRETGIQMGQQGG